jgi:hypothetical protein
MSEPFQSRAADQKLAIDRRAAQRFPFQGTALFHRPDEAGGGRRVDLHDISTVGISFTTDKPLKIGQKGVIEMQPETGSSEPKRLEIAVVWAVLNDVTRRYRVGCKWLQAVTDNDLSQFV